MYLLNTNIVTYVTKRRPVEFTGVFNQDADRIRACTRPVGGKRGDAFAMMANVSVQAQCVTNSRREGDLAFAATVFSPSHIAEDLPAAETA